jgi:hypothetical protein
MYDNNYAYLIYLNIVIIAFDNKTKGLVKKLYRNIKKCHNKNKQDFI